MVYRSIPLVGLVFHSPRPVCQVSTIWTETENFRIHRSGVERSDAGAAFILRRDFRWIVKSDTYHNDKGKALDST